MASPDTKSEPFTSSETSTFKISNVEITVTRSVNASHKPCNCGGHGGGMIDQLLTLLAQRMSPAPETPEDPSAAGGGAGPH